MALSDVEFEVLRRTIAARGTARMVMLPFAILAWAALAAAVFEGTVPPAGAVLALIVLLAGFEAVHALHVGVERIGRFLRVYYEGGPAVPQWETTVTALPPAPRGGAVDPLFTLVFGCAAVTNFVPVVFGRRPGLILLAGILHLAFLVRIVLARRASLAQRTTDVDAFRALRKTSAATGPSRE